MSLDFTIVEAAGILRLSGYLDIYAVESARTTFLDRIAGPGSLSLDLTEVKACDTAGVQLLCSVRQSSLRAGKPFRAELSSAARQCCARLGVSPEVFQSSTS